MKHGVVVGKIFAFVSPDSGTEGFFEARKVVFDDFHQGWIALAIDTREAPADGHPSFVIFFFEVSSPHEHITY